MKKSRMSESSRRTIIKATGAIGAGTASNALAASSGKAQVGLSLSEVSTFGATFRDDVHAYKAAGFDAIGVWEYKIPHKESDNQMISSLHDAQLRVATCVPTVSTILPGEMLGKVWGPRDPARRVAIICESISRFALFDPLSVLVITGPLGDLGPDRAHRIVIDGLREIADAARSVGVRVGLEPIHPMQREKVSFVNSIADAVSLLNHSGLENIGIMADTYNMWDEDPSDLAAIAHRVTGLHVAVCQRKFDALTACYREKEVLALQPSRPRCWVPVGITGFSTLKSSQPRSYSGACPSTRPPSPLTVP